MNYCLLPNFVSFVVKFSYCLVPVAYCFFSYFYSKLNCMKKPLFIICFLITFSLSAQKTPSDFCSQSLKASLIPIHAGKDGTQPFWNANAKMFKYAPAFDFIKFNGLKSYLFSAFSFTDKQTYTFTSTDACAPLTPIWDKLPTGEVYLKVEAPTGSADETVLSGSKLFYKAATFCPPYPPAKYTPKQALLKGLKYIYNLSHIRSWYTNPMPNHKEYILYCYPAKMLGAVINSMLLYDKYFPGKDSALTIAKHAADYLIAHAEPQGSPLEFFPQTYEDTSREAGKYKNEIIVMEPPQTGLTLLRLFDKTHEKKYFSAALNIASTFSKLQLPSGTWYIRIYKDSGKPTSQTLCIPIGIVNFLSELVTKYKQTQFQKVIDPAVKWIWANPVKTYNWTGQFEDVPAWEPYKDLTKYEASWFAQYIFSNNKNDSSSLHTAKELLAFCEDQFVVWDKPQIYDSWHVSSHNWYTPSALEQYECYVPIDASVTQMAFSFLKAFYSTGDELYHQKALTLINSLINVQKPDGLIQTFWKPDADEIWLNCLTFDLSLLDSIIDKNH